MLTLCEKKRSWQEDGRLDGESEATDWRTFESDYTWHRRQQRIVRGVEGQ
jgi:hypothetical protein